MLTSDTESTLIQRVLRGEPSAFATLVDQYQGYVFSVALKYVTNREIAEELAQDVFVKAYRNLADFKGSSKFSTWLYSITHNTCVSHLRKKKSPILLPGDEHLHAIADTTGCAQHAGMRMEAASQQKTLANAIGQLNATDAQIVTLFYLGEQSLDEIGLVLGLTPNNVKVRLFRARQKLRELLNNSW
jgi:RNA polymerase sigma-70 factor (ECF subfamily)